ncbi:MAG: hypothetical protein JWP01_2117 [Myxococcales bacterium]|nr:hypothetical protein [Myxococcales bacterium]
MMSTCQEVQDDLADLVAGDRDAIARHSEHLAGCDACRDARHEATELAAMLGAAGSDHVPPGDLVARVLAAATADPAKADAGTAETIQMPTAAKETSKDDAKAKDAKVTPIRKPSRTWLVVGAAAAIAAGGVGIYAMRRTDDGASPTTKVATTSPVVSKDSIGKLATVARAAADGGQGVSVRVGQTWRALEKGQIIPVGAAIKTDDRTRAGLELADGTSLVLDHGTELSFDPREARAITMTAGRISADVAHVEKRPASISTKAGLIDVIGTKFVLTSTDALTSVQVVRGSVALTTTGGQRDEIHAGEEGLVENGALSIGAAPSLVHELGWSELTTPVTKPGEEATAGLGALRAYKPGEKRDRDWKLALAKHDVKVRISGPIARTEITETFRNDSAETLEGVYQFPLPADAQIDGLSLDMPNEPGGFIDGAFVAKGRAAKIWQGVIDKATPMQIARPSSEIIWVPGRWKDPALLDWKRGGRFELKIYPIPANGARTIKLSYTQVVTARGPFRQYVYPLAHSVDGSTVADNFTVDVEVRGAQPGLIRTAGYQMVPDARRTDVNALTLASSGFVPRGDLVVDYRATDGDAELRAWTYAGGAAVGPNEKLSGKKNVGIDPKVLEAQRAVAADARPTAVLALHPALPRWRETRPRDFMIVVDSSQSMVGERFTRATELALGIVEQMDRRDRFSIAACDSECRRLGDLRAPSDAAAKEARTWLTAQIPAGASDVVQSIRSAAVLPASDREKWVLYISDGFSTTGFRRVADVERALTEVADKGVQVTTIGIGGDADLALLSAAARGGGGSYLAWVPGQSVQIAALSALESTNGAALRNATIELPSGLADVAPTVLPTVRSGEEVLIAARITGDVKGEVIVRGKIGGQPYEQKYPLELKVSTAAGNGFVPRLWATLAIEQMERRGEGDDRIKTIALSQGYGVMSRETSLLVLESQAMFDAFGVDRSSPAAKWTGEESLDEVVTAGTIAMDRDAGGGMGTGAASAPTGATRAGADMMSLDEGKAGKKDSEQRPAPTTTPTMPEPVAPPPADAPSPAKAAAAAKRKSPSMLDDGELGSTMRGRGMVAMRRTWVRVPAVTAYGGVGDNIKKAIANSDAALVANPDSREKHRALVQALAYAGEIDRAREIANRWLDRDKLDPQALGYQADLLGRDGQRELALRTLAGLIDLDADRVELHERMIRAYEMAGRLAQSCSHRIALAALSPKDTIIAGATMRCLRMAGRETDAQLISRALPDDATRAAAEKTATVPAIAPRIGGDLVITAQWAASADLDLSIVTPEGKRVSWMGGRTDVVVTDATSVQRERLSVKSLKRGNYLIEISRGDGAQGPIRGSLEITVLGTKKSLPFELLGSRVVVSRVAVALEERLEQMTNIDSMVPVRPTGAVGISGIADAAVSRVVVARSGGLRACYLRELNRDPSLQGRLDVTLSIDGAGTVTSVMAGGSMGNGGVTQCVQRQLRLMRFPTGVDPNPRFSVVFRPQ